MTLSPCLARRKPSSMSSIPDMSWSNEPCVVDSARLQEDRPPQKYV